MCSSLLERGQEETFGTLEIGRGSGYRETEKKAE